MITFTSTSKHGRRLICLGLERENVTRLTAGKPILATSAKHALPVDVDVLVVFGETTDELMAELKKAGLVGEETPIRSEP